MELLHCYLCFLLLLLLLLLLPESLYSQQVYLNETVYDCTDTPSTSKGYLCNGLMKSCISFMVFRSKHPYDNPVSIAYLLSSEASIIASINKLPNNATSFPSNTPIIVPVFCSCHGNIYSHYAPYTVKNNDTYYELVKTTYQGLTTCQALMGQNYYPPNGLPIGAELTVPVLCACPTENQTKTGVTSLLVDLINYGDTLKSIGEGYGVDEQSMLEANKPQSENSSSFSLMAFTPILVPLRGKSCKEDPNSFYCNCSKGFLPDGSLKGIYCDESHGQNFPAKLVLSIGVGIGVGLLCFFLLGYKLYQYIQKKRERIHKEKLFKQNGGHLLQEKVSSSHGNGSQKIIKLFTAEELQRATDNYNWSRFLGQGGYGKVYKGMLPDGTIVAVKRSKEIERNQIETFVNEVVILSQINHRNIVKLLGCCLETEAPLLVYEFIPNGTLAQHIHSKDHESCPPLSWDCRLRIACEVAGAVAYMHSSASIPIFHRDIKPTNILLDSNYGAKVSDFGTSRSLPHDKTHLTTAIGGTFGYIDPEYFQSSQFSDKSDVYSFGVVLVEIITGKKPISFMEEDEGQNLIGEFISAMKEDKVCDILDPKVLKEAKKDEVVAISKLAMRCLRLNGKKRPTMKEVSAELESLRKVQSSMLVNNHDHHDHDEKLLHKHNNSVVQEYEEESILMSLQLQMESPSF